MEITSKSYKPTFFFRGLENFTFPMNQFLSVGTQKKSKHPVNTPVRFPQKTQPAPKPSVKVWAMASPGEVWQMQF